MGRAPLPATRHREGSRLPRRASPGWRRAIGSIELERGRITLLRPDEPDQRARRAVCVEKHAQDVSAGTGTRAKLPYSRVDRSITCLTGHRHSAKLIGGGQRVTPAAASEPLIVDVAFTIDGPYGPGPCSLWATGSGTRHVETFSDASGNPVLVRRHVIFTGTVTNTATGKAVPYGGDFTVTRDVVADTNTYAGLLRETAIPGQPAITAAGQMVTTADFPPQLISESGRTIDTWLAAVCQLTGS